MKMKVLKVCRIGGRHCKPGDIVDVPANDVSYLEHRKFAEPYKGKKAAIDVAPKVKIKLHRACLIDGKHAAIGSVCSVSASDAKFLVARKHAEFVSDSPTSNADKAAAEKAEAIKAAEQKVEAAKVTLAEAESAREAMGDSPTDEAKQAVADAVDALAAADGDLQALVNGD